MTILDALVALCTIENFLWANLGALLGIIIGCIPGLTVTLGIILFLPLTYQMDAVTSIVMMLSLYTGGMYGGSISAILINTPGTNSALATTLDGYPLARSGKARKALMCSLMSSVCGGLLAAFVLLLAAPQVAKIALKFGAPEYFMLALFGMSVIAGVSGKSMLKGIISAMFGVFIASLGLDSFTGIFRFSFDSNFFMGGVPLLPALIGTIALQQIIVKVVETCHEERERKVRWAAMSAGELAAEQATLAKARKEEIDSLNGTHRKKGAVMTADEERIYRNGHLSFKEFWNLKWVLIKSSALSILIGAMPGAGGGIAQFVSYNEAKRGSKHRELFGRGSLEGLAAAESSNNAVVGSAMIPLLTLGIPGDGVTAILLGALTMKGLTPGPTLFTVQAKITYAIIIGNLIANFILLYQGYYLTQAISRIIQVSYKYLCPMLMIFCFAGAFANANNMNEMIMIVPLAVFSYIIDKLGFSVVPMMLGLILGPLVESNLTRSLIISEGNPLIFVTRPVSLAILIVTVIFVIIFVRMNVQENNMLTDEGAANALKQKTEATTL
jgi:putative tricarboxylic transport membrane protein